MGEREAARPARQAVEVSTILQSESGRRSIFLKPFLSRGEHTLRFSFVAEHSLTSAPFLIPVTLSLELMKEVCGDRSAAIAEATSYECGNRDVLFGCCCLYILRFARR